jgi:hypothetical protein
MRFACFSLITSAYGKQIKVVITVGIKQQQPFVFSLEFFPFYDSRRCELSVFGLFENRRVKIRRSPYDEIFQLVAINITNGDTWPGL